MVCGAACYYVDFIEAFDVFFCKLYAIENYLAVFVHPAHESVTYALRLFMYLLEHEMVVTFLFGRISVPCDIEYIAMHFFVVCIVYLYIVCCQDYHFIVFYEVDLTHVLEQRRYV